MWLSYKDYIAIRDLMVEIDGNETEEDRLTPAERGTLTSLHKVISEIERHAPWRQRGRGAKQGRGARPCRK